MQKAKKQNRTKQNVEGSAGECVCVLGGNFKLKSLNEKGIFELEHEGGCGGVICIICKEREV